MKAILLFLSFSLAGMLCWAQKESQDSWKITWNRKVILQTGKSDESANIRKIKSTDLNKQYSLELSYKEATTAKEKEWVRSFMFFDESGRELIKKDNTHTIKMTAAQLKKLFAGKKKIQIYTIAIPSDPDLAARVRVRKVHLCTLELQ